MKRFRLVALLALSLPVAMTALAAQAPAPKQPAPPKPVTKAGGAARTIEMTGGDDMRYNVTEIKAKPGETIRIQLKNVGTLPKMAMAHNVVVVKPTTKLAEFNSAGAAARETNFIAPAMKVKWSPRPSLPVQGKPSKPPSRCRRPRAATRSCAPSPATSRLA